jgi:hypothetical protein
MSSEEVYKKALRLIELAKATTNSSRRHEIIEDAFELIRLAKKMRRREPHKTDSEPRPRYRVWFHGEFGFLYLDLPLARRADALWAAEALAWALSEDYGSYALWDGQTQLLHSRTSLAVLTNRTAVRVSRQSHQVVLDALELTATNHKMLARSERFREAMAQIRRIVAEAGGTMGSSGEGTA